MGETIEALVDAGKASAGPPLGPSLGPTGVNVKDVVDEINSKTKEMAGMQVPVKIKIDDKKGFTIDIGTPPASSLIKQVLGIEKGSGEAGSVVAADMTLDQAITVAKQKGPGLTGVQIYLKLCVIQLSKPFLYPVQDILLQILLIGPFLVDSYSFF